MKFRILYFVVVFFMQVTTVQCQELFEKNHLFGIEGRSISDLICIKNNLKLIHIKEENLIVLLDSNNETIDEVYYLKEISEQLNIKPNKFHLSYANEQQKLIRVNDSTVNYAHLVTYQKDYYVQFIITENKIKLQLEYLPLDKLFTGSTRGLVGNAIALKSFLKDATSNTMFFLFEHQEYLNQELSVTIDLIALDSLGKSIHLIKDTINNPKLFSLLGGLLFINTEKDILLLNSLNKTYSLVDKESLFVTKSTLDLSKDLFEYIQFFYENKSNQLYAIPQTLNLKSRNLLVFNPDLTLKKKIKIETKNYFAAYDIYDQKMYYPVFSMLSNDFGNYYVGKLDIRSEQLLPHSSPINIGFYNFLFHHTPPKRKKEKKEEEKLKKEREIELMSIKKKDLKQLEDNVNEGIEIKNRTLDELLFTFKELLLHNDSRKHLITLFLKESYDDDIDEFINDCKKDGHYEKDKEKLLDYNESLILFKEIIPIQDNIYLLTNEEAYGTVALKDEHWYIVYGSTDLINKFIYDFNNKRKK